MDKAQKAFEKYVEAATILAESVKRNIVHEGVIDNETILKLNEFIIASNEIEDLLAVLVDSNNENNGNLN